MITQLTQRALALACARSSRAFAAQRFDLQAVQERLLQQLQQQIQAAQSHKRWANWQQFREQQPLTRYQDWAPSIDRQRQGGSTLIASPVVRYQPTSGSSATLKRIPYTRQFLTELDAAIAPWLASMFRHHPRMYQGRHYWSVSWLPQSQQAEFASNLNDDSELLGGVKRWLAARSQAVPAGVAMAAQADDAVFATLAYLLACADLRLLSVWSPTFALQLLEALPRWGEEFMAVLASGHWGKRRASLQGLAAPYAPKRVQVLKQALASQPQQYSQILWPELALVSAWATADAKIWAQQLQQSFPQASFEGKGLWATEGVVTIPVDDCYPLAYRSHVYEFEDLSTGNIVAPWQLREGDRVSPIISTGSGLLRYQLDDQLQVTGFWGSVPCFEFLGRRFGVDLVGEKLSPTAARQVLDTVASQFPVQPVILLAVDCAGQQRPRYVALFSGQHELVNSKALASAVEQALRQHFHYELARDLHQLHAAEALVVTDGWLTYQHIAVAGGMIEGNIKPEPIRRVALTAVLQVLPQLTAMFVAQTTPIAEVM